MKIGLLGGTFDPVHAGHLALGKAALKQLRLARLYFVLSPHSPFKTRQKKQDTRDRLAMLRAAVKGKKRFSIGLWELKRTGKSYTVNTLKFLKRKRPTDEFFFVMGSDLLPTLKKWKDPKGIADRCRIAVGKRPGFKEKRPPKDFHGRLVYLKGVFPRVSSTILRKKLKAGEKRPAQLPPAVYRVIRKKDLYE